jgi:cell division protein FtsA
MHGSRLDVETHIITASITSVQNLVKCVRSIGVDVEDLVLEPLASGEAVLTPEEMDTGIIMADIGGGTTDIAVFKDSSIYHSAIIPVAGYQVTSDISIGLGLPFEIGEKMKKKYGNVMPSLEIDEGAQVGIENGHSASYKQLCSIIRARMEELLQLIPVEMPTTDYRTLAPCGLVLTGGTANLPGLDELGQTVLRMPVRIGLPLTSTGVYGISDILHDPAYATTLGLILWQVRGKEGAAFPVKRAGFFGGFMNLLRRLFRA